MNNNNNNINRTERIWGWVEPPVLGRGQCLSTLPPDAEKPSSWLRCSAGPMLLKGTPYTGSSGHCWRGSELRRNLAMKETFTSSDDKREVMPVCVVAVGHINISLTNNLF